MSWLRLLSGMAEPRSGERIMRPVILAACRGRSAADWNPMNLWFIPQFDPVAFHLGPLAVRWYGLMYLVGFALLWIAGRYRIKTPSGRRVDAEGPRRCAVLRDPGHDPRRPAGLRALLQVRRVRGRAVEDLLRVGRRHVVPRRLPRRGARDGAVRAQPPAGLARDHRFHRAARAARARRGPASATSSTPSCGAGPRTCRGR